MQSIKKLFDWRRNTSSMTTNTTIGNFDRVLGPISLDSANIQLIKWKSRRTGLSVIWAQVDGPLVHGCLAVPTEIFNDSGVPHTLEHLIFLGSQKYPHKGILDTLANRAFATGTNAWTDTTHTAYTVNTAGFDGFLRLLPIYFDHVLYPTITPEGFTTEVYHLNGKGEDGGVVYSEMQARENTSGDLMALRNQRLLYPPTSAYRSETGGLMEALRILTPDQIRTYQKQYYHPHNLQLVVTGNLDPAALLKVLQEEVEPSLIEHGQDKAPEGWKRPFLETPSKGGACLAESRTEVVEFPTKDESMGEVQISWVGPSTNDFLLQTALDVLGIYLTDSAVSPLSKKFIEIDSPLCTDIDFSPTDAEKITITAHLSSVPSDHLLTISDTFKGTLADEAMAIDIERMKMIIEREALKTSNKMEVDPHDTLLTAIISNLLYGDNHDLETSLLPRLARFRTLASWTAAEWSKVFQEWLVCPPSLTVIGQPSAALAKKLKEDTKQRVKATRKKYRRAGLRKLARKLAHAREVNEQPYPDKFISDFPVPSLKSINWIDVEVAQTGGQYSSDLQSYIDQKDPADLPVFLQFNHIESNFLSIYVTLSPSDLPAGLFELIPIYLESFFSLPVKRRDGSRVGYEEVVKQLDTLTVEYDINLGDPISQTMQIYMRVEKSKYAAAVGWLRDLLWGSEFDPDRLRITATKAMQDIPSWKRDGSEVSSALYRGMLYSTELSPLLAVNLFKLEVSLPKVLEKLESSPGLLLEQMEQLRASLLKSSCMRISVAGDIRGLEEPKTTWLKQFEQLQPAELERPLMGNLVLGSEGNKPSGKVVVMTMPSTESCYSYHFARGPQGFGHPDQAALLVALSMLNAMEGFLWKAIRGPGLAYSARMGSNVETGHVYLNIYRSPDYFKAFVAAHTVVTELVEQKVKLSELVVESGKGSFAHSVASNVATCADAAYKVFVDTAFKGLQPDASRVLLEKAKDVQVEDILGVMGKYLMPLFDPSQSSGVVASSGERGSSIAEGMRGLGYSVELKEISGGGGGGGDEGSEGEAESSEEESASSQEELGSGDETGSEDELGSDVEADANGKKSSA